MEKSLQGTIVEMQNRISAATDTISLIIDIETHVAVPIFTLDEIDILSAAEDLLEKLKVALNESLPEETPTLN